MEKNQVLKSHQGGERTQTSPRCSPIRRRLPIVGLCLSAALLLFVQPTGAVKSEAQVSSDEPAPQPETASDGRQPANHRMDVPVGEQPKSTSARRGRQYDGGPLGASAAGSYAAIAGDSGAYVGGSGAGSLASAGGYSSTAASSPGVSSYASDPIGLYSTGFGSGGGGAYPDQLALAGRGVGYGLMHSGAGGAYPQVGGALYGGGAGASPLAAMFHGGGGGGVFSSSPPFPLMAKGFDVSEIVCTAVAVAIGAVIVGAPFILLYLFVMNQMQGNGASTAMGPGGGSISLTGPTSSTNVSGRKKRHTSLPEALFKQLSPLVNSDQVAQTFKLLMSSLAKYQM